MQKLNIHQDEYRKIDALSNNELQLFSACPALYAWNKAAPQDPNKADAKDMGTALHALLLEPETYEDEIIVSNFKGRTTQGFQKEQFENPNKIVLTEIEAQQVKIMAMSAMANPMFSALMKAPGENEVSIVIDDESRGIKRKIRPDKIANINGCDLLLDLKKTADIDKWRKSQRWLNPLFEFNYAYTAAYYMDTYSMYLGEDINEYVFPIVQSSAALGRYPATVFTVTRQQLQTWAYSMSDPSVSVWDKVQNDLDEYAKHKKANSFHAFEQFPDMN